MNKTLTGFAKYLSCSECLFDWWDLARYKIRSDNQKIYLVDWTILSDSWPASQLDFHFLALLDQVHFLMSNLICVCHSDDKSERFNENIIFITRTYQDQHEHPPYMEIFIFLCRQIILNKITLNAQDLQCTTKFLWFGNFSYSGWF